MIVESIMFKIILSCEILKISHWKSLSFVWSKVLINSKNSVSTSPFIANKFSRFLWYSIYLLSLFIKWGVMKRIFTSSEISRVWLQKIDLICSNASMLRFWILNPLSSILIKPYLDSPTRILFSGCLKLRNSLAKEAGSVFSMVNLEIRVSEFSISIWHIKFSSEKPFFFFITWNWLN